MGSQRGRNRIYISLVVAITIDNKYLSLLLRCRSEAAIGLKQSTPFGTSHSLFQSFELYYIELVQSYVGEKLSDQNKELKVVILEVMVNF